jgi:hypothetical protein
MKRGRLEKVLWRDAYQCFDESDVKKDYIVETVGWVRKRGKFLMVTSEHTASHERRGITMVPRSAVVHRRRLR